MSDSTGADLAALYLETQDRLARLVAGLDAAQLTAMVPACPDWAVRDVVAHLTAICEDALAGKLAGIPTDDFTADQVVRFADVQVPEMLSRWTAAAAQFAELAAAFGVWPAVIDVVSHEQDIRGAVGLPGARDTVALRHVTGLLLAELTPPVPVRVVTEHGEFVSGPDQAGPGELTVSSTTYETCRWRMGRRSKAQLAAMNWSADPALVLDHLTVFGPALIDIVE